MVSQEQQGSFEVSVEVTEDQLEEARSWIGRELVNEPYNEFATIDTIRHFSYGFGDDNPLWCDAEYGSGTAYGSVIAPPTWPYSTSGNGLAPGCPGLQPFDIGGMWRWNMPIFEGDRINASMVLTHVEPWNGQNASKGFVQVGRVDYRNQRNQLVATSVLRNLRVGRRAVNSGLSYESRAEHEYSPEEMRRLESDIRAEFRRGGRPFVIEETFSEKEMTPVIKGPLNRMSMASWYAGCLGSPGYRAAELAWKNRFMAREDSPRLPTTYDKSYFLEVVSPSSGHQDHEVARDVGMPGAYDNGAQRVSSIIHVLTNWMGDGGFLSQADVRLKKPVIFGDTLWCRGTVESVEVVEDGCLAKVKFSLRADNQLGSTVADGAGEILLPTREGLKIAPTAWHIRERLRG